MNEMKLLGATTGAGLPEDRFGKMERYNSPSYRCALHLCAMLRRPKTIGFTGKEFSVSSAAPKSAGLNLPFRCKPLV
jgi:hypothetical protein